MTFEALPLAGRTVLVPRAPERARALAERLRELGAHVLVAPVTATAAPGTTESLDAAVRGLDGYAWVAVTSVNGVEALVAASARTGVTLADAATSWAAVGPATSRALQAAGVEVALEAAGTAADLAAAFPPPPGLSGPRRAGAPAAPDNSPRDDVSGPRRSGAPATPDNSPRDDVSGPRRSGAPATPDNAQSLGDVSGPGGAGARCGPDTGKDARVSGAGEAPRAALPGTASGARVLLPLGDLARTTLADGLGALGWDVQCVVAYRTVAAALPADVVAAAREGRIDAVVVAAGSAAREIARQLGRDAPPVVAIGNPSAEAATAAGLQVVAIASAPTDAALAEALCAVAVAENGPLRSTNTSPPAPTATPPRSDT
ncbi:uroporphyrinogen-III synthase [Xylanimonas sp. McL0601]|uniref:uroporphyrinogen-III synthase n=1 Tax=Xylanimonas sp. McL0601 TaxID=3414739 RepID=UPI003CEBB6E1